jgi:hypothetical protein
MNEPISAPKIPKGKFNYLLPIPIVTLIACVVTSICGLAMIIVGMSESSSLSYKVPSYASIISTDKWGQVISNEILVMLKGDFDRTEADRLGKLINGKVVGEFDYINLFQIQLSASNEEEFTKVIEKLESLESIEAVTPHIVISNKRIEGKQCKIMDETVYGKDKNNAIYRAIGLQDAWDMINSAKPKLSKVKVGVVDNGLYPDDPDIKNNKQVRPLNPDDISYIPDTDSQGRVDMGGTTHGTAVTNVVVGKWENGGVVGVSSGLNENVEVMVSNLSNYEEFTKSNFDPNEIDEINHRGITYVLETLQAFKDQIKAGATVINYSIGPEYPSNNFAGYSKMMEKFLARVHKEHPEVLFVVAAGNEGHRNVPLNGKNYGLGGIKAPNLITVGALGKDGKPTSWTNKTLGDGEITISAIGEQVPVAIGDDGKVVMINGTSFAAPQVAGAATILRSINPLLTAEEIKKILVESSNTVINEPSVSKDSIQVDSSVGGRILRIDNAVLRVINDIRIKEDLPIYTKEQLVEKSKVYAWGELINPSEFKITAQIKEVGENGTEVDASMIGAGYLGSNSNFLPADGEMYWIVELLKPEDSLTVKITRLDTNACATVAIVGKSPIEEPTPSPTPVPTRVVYTPVPTKIFTRAPKPTNTPVPTRVPPTPTPIPTAKPVASPWQIVTDCNLCWNAGITCSCGTYQCRCCPNNDDSCNAYDL